MAKCTENAFCSIFPHSSRYSFEQRYRILSVTWKSHKLHNYSTEYGTCALRSVHDDFWILCEFALNNAPEKYYSIRPVRVFLQAFVVFDLFLCFAYESKLLDCLIKRVKMSPTNSINGIAEMLETEQYRLITSREPETSNWFISLRTSPLESIRRLGKALEKNRPILVETFDKGFNELLQYSLGTIRLETG